MNKYRIFIVTIFISCFINLLSCKTTGQFSGTAKLVVLIVDETGKGVNNCSITLSNFNKSENGVTNASGMCVFNNVPAGEYSLLGCKTGYTKLKPAAFCFNDKSDVFCFEILSSEYVFDYSEQLFLEEKYTNAIELLDEIYCDKKSSVNATVCLYKAYGFTLQENRNSALAELKKMKKADKSFTDLYSMVYPKIEAAFERKLLEVE